MPKLIIDDREIEVPEGTRVIEAAERLGIMIPRFCYHRILGAVGACRMCAVKLLHKKFRGVEMSCMIYAQEGMIVSTTHPEAVAFRKRVIEWLMINHPHDCPVCDEGGHCLLQDETVSSGHGIRQYRGKKRTYRDQYLGVFVQHEMNRCIHCYRCSRFYQEFSGYRDLGAMQIGDRVYFGRYAEGELESPFSGNLIDICPTGVYTDKPSRYRYRRWELQRSPSLCIHCSLVCRTIAGARFREVMRQEAPVDELDKGFFICDRGRYGFPYTNLEERPRKPLLKGKEAPWDFVIAKAAEGLKRVASASGPSSIVAIGSPRASLETLATLKRLSREAGWMGPVSFLDGPEAQKSRGAVAGFDDSPDVSLQDLESADLILVVGADPLNESPVLALSIRQAWRRGAKVVVLDPRPISLPLEFRHLAVRVDDLDTCLAALVRGGLERAEVEKLGPAALGFFDALPGADRLDPSLQEAVSESATDLRKSRRPALICGTGVVRESTPALAADCSRLLRGVREFAALFYTLRGPNSFGSVLLSGPQTLSDAIRGIEEGAIKAAVIVENDPFFSFPDRARLERALSKLELILVMDYLPSETVSHASAFFPTRTLFETGAHFVGQDGRVRFAHPVHEGGIPIHLSSGGSHPPRVYQQPTIPGGAPRPAWQVLLDLGRSLSHGNGNEEGTRSRVRTWMEELPNRAEEGPVQDGTRLYAGSGSGVPFSSRVGPAPEARPEELELLLVERVFGTEELSTYSPWIREVEGEPVLFLSIEDAASMGLVHGDRIEIRMEGGPVEVSLEIPGRMAPGTAVLPRHRILQWKKVQGYSVKIPKSGFRSTGRAAP